MVRLTDSPAMTIAVDLGCKATKQTKVDILVKRFYTGFTVFDPLCSLYAFFFQIQFPLLKTVYIYISIMIFQAL